MAQIVKRVLYFRHSVKGKEEPHQNVLCPTDGHPIARAVGAEVVRGRNITGYYVSSYFRATQTLVALVEGAADCVVENVPGVKNLAGAPMEEWELNSKEGHSLEAIETAHPDFIAEVSARMEREIRTIIDETPDGGTSLAVGHTPALELAVQMLTRTSDNPNGTRPAPFKPCDGILLAILEDGTVTIEQEFRRAA